MRDICHFKSLPASQLSQCRVPRPDAAAVFMSHKCRESRKQWIAYTDSMSRFLKPRYMISFFSDSAAGQGLKSSLRTKTNSVCRRPFSYFIVHLDMRWVLYNIHSNHPLPCYGSLESSVFLQERLQCRPRPCLQPLQPCLVSAHHGTSRPAFQPALPSVLCRSEPS